MFDWSDGCGGFRRPVRGSYGLDSLRDCCAESDGWGGSCIGSGESYGFDS